MEPRVHTCGAASPALPVYEAQAAALILVAMKLLYGLDDRTEWWARPLPALTHAPGVRHA